MKEKVVLIGAGSVSFTRGLVADLLRRDWDTELALVDISPQALSVAEGLVRKMIEAKRPSIRLSASLDRRKVLEGATVVICTVGVGGRRGWEKDFRIPRKFGIYQPVGDSVMPGGTSRALRMIPPMVGVARDLLDLCPNALFFNYGNPMAPVCRAIRKATSAPVVGLCHGVNGVAHYLADALGVARDQMAYTAVGMNHLTWFTEVRVQGQDAMPRLREIAKKRLGKAVEGRHWDQARWDMDSPFSWQLFLLFNAFPAVLDRHVTEFFPQFFREGRYYGHTLGTDVFDLDQTISGGDRAFEEMKRVASSPKPLTEEYFKQFGGEHEQVIDIVASIRADAGLIYSANLPNRGQVPNLPTDAIVESPSVATAAGLKPIAQPPLPSGIAGTLATRLQWVETVVEAAIEGSRDKLVQALVLDGSVDSLGKAVKLADALLRAHAEDLPQFE